MKRFIMGVIAVAGITTFFTFASCGGGGGPACKKTTCVPACGAASDGGIQVCDTKTFTCVEYKTCATACTATQYCNQGTCETTPVPKTCATACTGIQFCDTTSGTCKDVAVCSPVCDATKGEYCTN